jgi:hypothetical protein
MTPTKEIGSDSASNMREAAPKEWRPPELRKLPIAATAGDSHIGGNDGNTAKNGLAGSNS